MIVILYLERILGVQLLSLPLPGLKLRGEELGLHVVECNFVVVAVSAMADQLGGHLKGESGFIIVI